MKSRIIHKEEIEKSELKYPVLMKHIQRSIIVLFYSESAGLLIHDGGNGIQPNQHAPNWTPATNTAFWKKFEGIIELSNS